MPEQWPNVRVIYQRAGFVDQGRAKVVLLASVEQLPRPAEPYRRRGVATWLVGQAAEWLRLARVERLLDDGGAEEHDRLALLGRLGFRELTRTARGWVHAGRS